MMEQTLAIFFDAINRKDVETALACFAENISCEYPDPGRNWTGKERGRTVMTGIFSLLQSEVTYKLNGVPTGQINTTENWGDGGKRTVKTTYTFDADNKIVAMKPTR
jgi:ketosteroid isomerase-like protein